jgi:hypothetical protein
MSRTSDRTYQRRRARLKRSPEGDVCWQCHLPIDTELLWPHPLSWTADHVEPVGKGGSNHGLILPAHWRCNQARNRKRHPPTHHSRQW